jgi:hypothetical protein
MRKVLIYGGETEFVLKLQLTQLIEVVCSSMNKTADVVIMNLGEHGL